MDDFSDDDLDGLAEDDLLALEEASAPPTQALSHPLHTYTRTSASRPQEIVQNGGGAAFNISAVGHRDHPQPAITTRPISRPAVTTKNEEQAARLSANQQPGPSTQREQWRQRRYAATTPGLHRAATLGTTTLPHHPASPAREDDTFARLDARDSGHQQEASLELARLKNEIEQLRNEQERLRQAAKNANDQMLVKAGEISILRSNQAKVAQEFERRLEDMRNKQMLDTERHQAELEQSRKEKERLASHNQFLNHERNDQNWQLKQGQTSALQAKANGKTSGAKSKMRKEKPTHFGDGFDDDELMIISPSRSITRSRNTTPKSGLKRKRDALADSPLKPLELNQSIEYLPEADIDLQPLQISDPVVVSDKQNQSFVFLQQLLNHQISRGERKTHEVLSRFSYPSDSKTTLSTIFTDKLAAFSFGQDSEDFPSAVGNAVLSMWSRCIEERHHEPVRYLRELTEFVLLQGSPLVVASLVDSLVDLAQRTADVNVIPRYKRFRRKLAADEPDNRPLDPNISTKSCLELLDLTITLCMKDQELVKRFWKSVRFDFISMLLRNSQDVHDVTLMVKILSTSVRTDTFAMIVAPPASQSVSEQHVIDRLSAMLIETPRILEGEPQPDAAEIADMRLEILNLVEAMLLEQYCGEAFTNHPAALGRLVRVMHDELNAVYTQRYGHEKRAELVNQATRLLYQITKEYQHVVGQLQEKLRTPPTSVYKHLVVLSRLAFSEGSVLEENIEEDVVEMAHEMLELMVSPEEGEAIQKAFVKEGVRHAVLAPATEQIQAI